MFKKCPVCRERIAGRDVVLLAMGVKRRCNQCGTLLHKSLMWTFVLYCMTVISAIASLGFINLFGLSGILLAGAVPVTLFAIGSIFVPVVSTDRV